MDTNKCEIDNIDSFINSTNEIDKLNSFIKNFTSSSNHKLEQFSNLTPIKSNDNKDHTNDDNKH